MKNGIDIWSLDLTRWEPGTRPPKPPKKDHSCPHDREHPTGMEVCRACGDYGICTTCGEEYIKRDAYTFHLTLCWPCAEVALVAYKLEQLRSEQAKRIARRSTSAD